jgi:hypothetical protein
MHIATTHKHSPSARLTPTGSRTIGDSLTFQQDAVQREKRAIAVAIFGNRDAQFVILELDRLQLLAFSAPVSVAVQLLQSPSDNDIPPRRSMSVEAEAQKSSAIVRLVAHEHTTRFGIVEDKQRSAADARGMHGSVNGYAKRHATNKRDRGDVREIVYLEAARVAGQDDQQIGRRNHSPQSPLLGVWPRQGQSTDGGPVACPHVQHTISLDVEHEPVVASGSQQCGLASLGLGEAAASVHLDGAASHGNRHEQATRDAP